MKLILKYPFIICFTLIIFIINIIPVFVFGEIVKISIYSLAPAVVMALVVINGVLACVFKHKGNFLMIRKYHSNVFSADKNYNEKIFRWMLFVYLVAIPFYIPIIFFASSWWETLWTLAVFFFPQATYIAHGVYQTIQDVKKSNRKQVQVKKERTEQEQREELGHWK